MTESLYYPVAGLSINRAGAHITTLEEFPRLRPQIDIPYYGAVLLALGSKLTSTDRFPTELYLESGLENLRYVQGLLRNLNSELALLLGVCVLPSVSTHPIESTSYVMRGMGIHGLNVVSESVGVCAIHTAN